MKCSDKFGLWTVLNSQVIKNKVLCRCGCGAEKMVNVYNLRAGKTVSCGCSGARGPIKHGLAKTPEYQVWKAMKARCYSQNHKNYADYGGRGIKVCDRWKDTFENFYRDMGKRPSRGHSIDRIDTNKDYSPENCRWATQKEQTRNTRRSKLLTYNGETKTLAEWAEMTGLLGSTLYHRIDAGWTPEKAIETPARLMRKAG